MVGREEKRHLKSRKHENTSLRPLQLEKSSWRNVVAAVWGVRAERGAFLCWSEKEQSEGKKGESEGGKSSQGQTCEAGLPLGRELWDRKNSSCLQMLWTKRYSKES